MKNLRKVASNSPPFGEPQKNVPAKRGRKKKLKKWQKPEGMPKRPLSAYNFFFAEQRQEMLNRVKDQDTMPLTGAAIGVTKNKTKGKIGFANLARTVAAKWKTLSDADKKPYFNKATVEQTRYKEAVKEWQSLGLDPRVKKEEKKSIDELDFSSNSTRCDHVPSSSCVRTLPSQNLSIAHGRLLAASNSAASTAESLRIATEVAKTTCWGDFYELEGEPSTSKQVDCDFIEVDDSYLEPIPIDDLMGVRAFNWRKGDYKGRMNGDHIDYKLLSSTLFNALAVKLDNEEVSYLKTAFARSA